MSSSNKLWVATVSISNLWALTGAIPDRLQLQCTCVRNAFLMLLLGLVQNWTCLSAVKFLTSWSSWTYSRKGVPLSCSLVPGSKINRKNCRESSQHFSTHIFERLKILIVIIWATLSSFCLPLPLFPKDSFQKSYAQYVWTAQYNKVVWTWKGKVVSSVSFPDGYNTWYAKWCFFGKCNKKLLILKYLDKIK